MLETVKHACEIVGGPERLAKILGCKRQALYQWEQVPRGRAIEIEEATDGVIPRHVLRPDLFQKPNEAA
jgi:DNA-binding transcriptional regulator YdaS (Cro superfamily)